ncbi:alpha/beta fold hydrolase [Streptomyces sp. NBC_00091]|uniref:alpha/beta hydrolase n=1 Tax=Streptomyces sp. NBC_00091 TaxID=2975648 RepID=UPI00225954F5|nr:alpha/beta fold hydrolase [Streptomyces sp. NBC_00091]MCX5376673.1 tetratricopeptide repeat protein [Streptomyces sp. NBC_00091]
MVVRTRVHLVLVHGLFSSAKVWTAFHELLTTDPELADWVSVHRFEYDSPLVRLRPDRRVAETDDVADQLGTFLETELADAERIVLVTHSQGGLIVQRFLARKLWNGEGAELARIRHFTMFACPNTGSGFFLTVRKALKLWSNPQEQQLRPFDRAVTEAQRTVLSAVVHGRTYSDQECPIPVRAYGGSADDIVPPVVARGVFPKGGVVTADHFSIVQPADRTAVSYMAVRGALLEAAQRTTTLPENVTPLASRSPAEAAGRPSLPPPAAGEPDLAPFPPPPYGQLEEGQLKGQERHSMVASLLAGEARQKVHVLAGLGGSGKSRLALEAADRAQRAGRRVWWVSMPELSLRMRMIARDLGAPSITVERAWLLGTATDLVWTLLNACPDPWLLIFDNADDPERLGPRGGQVADGTGWLRRPQNANGTVLVTSRVRRHQTWGEGSVVHQVVPLGEDDGASMLLERTGGLGGTNEEARRLSQQLGGLPLALRHAADAIKAVSESQISLDSDIRDFETFRRTVAARVETAPGQAGPDLSELLGREIVEKVCGIALDLLSKQELAQAATLLKVLACLSIAPIPYRCLLNGPLLTQSPLFPGTTPTRTNAALTGLEEFGLVDAYEREGVAERDLAHVLTMHPVVHGVLREDTEVRERPADYYGLAVRMVLQAAHLSNPDHPANWPLWAALAPHALEVSRACLLGDLKLSDRTVRTDALELARLTSRYLIATGLLGPAYDLVMPMVERCSSFGFDIDDREILGLRHEQGRIHLDREQLTQAEQVLDLVVRARTRILGENHADTLASRHKLARAINEQGGREEKAEEMLRSIVEAENEVRGPEHYDTLVVRHTLARTMGALGRHTEAEAEAWLILDISRRNHWPPSTPEILRVRETLAHALLGQGRAQEAEQVIREALRDASQPPDSNMVMRFRWTFVLVLLGIVGRTPEAVNELKALVRDLDRVVASEHPLSMQARDLLEKTLREMPG